MGLSSICFVAGLAHVRLLGWEVLPLTCSSMDSEERMESDDVVAEHAEKWGVTPAMASGYLQYLASCTWFAYAIQIPATLYCEVGVLTAVSTGDPTRKQSDHEEGHRAGRGVHPQYWHLFDVCGLPRMALFSFAGIRDPHDRGTRFGHLEECRRYMCAQARMAFLCGGSLWSRFWVVSDFL